MLSFNNFNYHVYKTFHPHYNIDKVLLFKSRFHLKLKLFYNKNGNIINWGIDLKLNFVTNRVINNALTVYLQNI